MEHREAKQQLQFVRKGDTLVWVNPPAQVVRRKPINKRTVKWASILAALLAAALWFWLDGGSLWWSAVVAEVMEFISQNGVQDAYLDLS